MPHNKNALMATISLTLICCLSIFMLMRPAQIADAQTNPCTGDLRAPATRGAGETWAQNSVVRVNVNSSQFSSTDLNCIKAVFESYNTAASQNASGLRFRVDYGTTAYATSVPGSGALTQSTQAGNTYSNVYQINRPQTLEGTNPAAWGQTGTGGEPRLTSAVTNINHNVTDCDALKMTLAHEIGHTLGLGECNGCPPRSSVMVGGVSRQNADGTITRLYNDTSAGLTGPTPCDSQTVKTTGQYNPSTMNQPPATAEGLAPTGGGEEGGGGGEEGGGGGGSCSPEYHEGECYYDGECDDWDPYTATCTVNPGYDYCDPGYWTDCP